MKLHYLGHEPGGAIPLPEGWPAFDHEEPDIEVASAKIASGKYQALADQEADDDLPVVHNEPQEVASDDDSEEGEE